MPQTCARGWFAISAMPDYDYAKGISLAPGVRAEVARAAARSSVLPEERTMFVVQNVTPLLVRDQEAKLLKLSQAPPPAIESRASAAPSERIAESPQVR